MSGEAKVRTGDGADGGRPWGLWARQVRAVLRLELRKTLFGRRALAGWLLALAPVVLTGIRAMVVMRGWERSTLATDISVFAIMYQSFVLRFVVFFGCAWIFANLFRGEILDRSLHFYFLSPVRRDVLAAAKFVSGLLSACILFGFSTAASLILTYLPHGTGPAAERLFGGSGLGHLPAYLMVTALGCVGYGAVFLATGLLFRNPMIPALVVLGWEFINFLLPPVLKKLSVVFYLVSLCPVRVSQGNISIVAEPASAWVAVPGLLGLATAALWIAARRIRTLEISYE